MLNEKSLTITRVHALWAYVYEILENATESLVTESRSVVAGDEVGSGGISRVAITQEFFGR